MIHADLVEAHKVSIVKSVQMQERVLLKCQSEGAVVMMRMEGM